MPDRQLVLANVATTLLGFLAVVTVVVAIIGAIHWDNRQHHNHRRDRIEACRAVADAHASALCVVATKP